MTWTVLYPEKLYPDDSVERRIFGPGVRVLMRDTQRLSELSEEDCARADGLMIMRQRVYGADFARFGRLRCVVRMGVG
ncbi:MAG TPA: C-terminal binding protein, partial [Acetobacteraceae bacterium]|nr:C-terminal binding protein [Acetobacteraceae bacterium]